MFSFSNTHEETCSKTNFLHHVFLPKATHDIRRVKLGVCTVCELCCIIQGKGGKIGVFERKQ